MSNVTLFAFIIMTGSALIIALVIHEIEARKERDDEYSAVCTAKGMKYMSFAKGEHYDVVTKTMQTVYMPVCIDDKGIMHTIEMAR